ncbi:hypothetical protein BIV24_11745 [Streptomyces colonosanans]|uniref:Cation-transporting P-type ATPase C-terminal domain-containing protein n=1 Tax=Streptomyces colonosanans TaxID=1428652 RepID=A0A1S2PIL8_9ACTN|nr:hypothetical protein BIV24_11745 [Streptomyces colonosanans]
MHVVEALQTAGRVVAMVGDGANDAAAIRAADIGVGIAVHGSAASRNAADLVIASDDLSMLVDAVAGGRALWRSRRGQRPDRRQCRRDRLFGPGHTTVRQLLSTRQILLVNLLTGMFLVMAASVTLRDESSEGQADGESVLGGTTPVGVAALGDPPARQIRHRGIVTTLGVTTAWLIGAVTPGSARRTSTMALCGVVGAQLTQTMTGRRHSPLVPATALGSAVVLIGLIDTPLVSQFFGCTPLGPVAWAGVAIAMGIAALGPRLEQLAQPLVHQEG